MERVKRIIKGHAEYFSICIVVYFFSMILGMVIARNTEVTINPTRMYFGDTLLHNGLVGLSMVIFGIITFGMFNTVFLAFNGFYLGSTLMGVYHSYGMTPLLSGVLPHAVIEIIAILISCTLGYESLRFVKIVKRNSREEKKEILHISDSLILVAVTFALYVAAALIEANFSKVNI